MSVGQEQGPCLKLQAAELWQKLKQQWQAAKTTAEGHKMV